MAPPSYDLDPRVDHYIDAACTVAIHEGEPINAKALRTMFEQIIANNRAGGWRRLKKS